MKKFSAILLVTLLGACAYKHQPIYNATDPIPPTAQKLALDRIEALIVAGGQTHGWKFDHIDNGHLVASLAHEKVSATVDIYFNQQKWWTAYKSSDGMRAENGTIHSHYNVWVRNLEEDINVRLNNWATPLQ